MCTTPDRHTARDAFAKPHDRRIGQHHAQPGHRRPVHPAGRHHGAGHARRLCLSGTGHRAQEEPGQCPGQDPGRLRGVDHRLLLRRLQVAYGTSFFVGAESWRQERLRTGQVLLPADLCGGHSGHRLGRHCRAGALRAAADRHRGARGPGLPAVRRRGVEPALRRAGLDQGATGAEFHDFAGSVVVHAVGGWIGLAGGAAAGRAPNRYRKDGASARTRRRPSLPGAGRLDAGGGLVRLQRDERADHRQDLGPGGRELADGHGGRHAGGAG
jgi:hypothetical protein